MNIENLNVKDLGDIVEASFQSEVCKVIVQIPIVSIINWNMGPILFEEELERATMDYLKQNLK